MRSFFSNLATRLRRDQRGATAVEYGIMVSPHRGRDHRRRDAARRHLERHLPGRAVPVSGRLFSTRRPAATAAPSKARSARKSVHTVSGGGRLRPAPTLSVSAPQPASRKAVPHVQNNGTGRRRGGVRAPRSGPGHAAAGHHGVRPGLQRPDLSLQRRPRRCPGHGDREQPDRRPDCGQERSRFSCNPALNDANITFSPSTCTTGAQMTLKITYNLSTMTGIAGPFAMEGKGVMLCGG